MIKKILWITAAAAYTLVLVVVAVCICAVKLLEPGQLTPLVCRVAEANLDADVSIASVELGFKPSYPLLRLDVRDLEIVSNSLRGLPDSLRRGLPAYSDTLLRVGRISGGINISELLLGNEISLQGLEVERPEVNIVITPDAANFDIYHTAAVDEEAASAAPIPAISIDSFRFIDPREIRFFNAADSTEASIVVLTEANLNGAESPDYRLKIEGELKGPYSRSILNLEDIAFGVDGRIHWEPSHPELLAVEQMRLRGAFLNAEVDAAVEFSDRLTVRSGRISIDTLRVSDVLTVLDEETRKKYRLKAPFFTTDASLSLTAELQRPYCPETDTVPYAEIKASIAECKLRYGKARIHSLSLEAAMMLAGDNLDSALVNVGRFTIAGPATSLQISGKLWRLLSDPAFSVTVKGLCDVASLPPQLAEAAKGSLSGKLRADLNFDGAMSMFTPAHFHEFSAEGSLKGTDLYFLSNDTAGMVEIPAVNISFDSRQHYETPEGETRTLLSARIEADTASMLFGGISLNTGGFILGAAAQNDAQLLDTTVVQPLGGGIDVRSLAVRSITDSAGVKVNNLKGIVTLNRFKNSSQTPRISLRALAGRVAAGAPGTVFLLSDASIDASTHLIPERAAMRKAMRQTADSIQRAHPELSPDSVLRLAVEKRRRRPHRHREMLEQEDDREIIDWNVSNSFRRYLLDWALEGHVSTRRAGLYTHYFPLRNRVDSLDFSFNTDTLELKHMHYRAGKSDLAVKGRVTNIRRALTGRKGRSMLKADFDVNSDTIDINQLAAAVFAGSAYGDKVKKGTAGSTIDIDSAAEMEESLDAAATAHTDSAGPLLMPVNVDARIGVSARNILYSDLHLNDFGGQLLLYDGALNLSRLRASSDAGSIDLSALYSAPSKHDMKFGFGMMLKNFKIEKFLSLVPALDSIMPLMRDFSGVIGADIAATVDIDSAMNFVLPTLDAAVKLSGDSLVFIDADTYRTLGKWLRFRDKADNTIKHMSVELLVKNNMLELFPFAFDIDRYRLGVLGFNDLALNFNYHIAVLKSPLPFKFGITVKGNPEKYKVRFGGAKFNEKTAQQHVAVVDTVRVNLVRQIQNVFRRGVSRSGFARLNTGGAPDLRALEGDERPLSQSDSLALIEQGILEAPPDSSQTQGPELNEKKKRKK